MARIINITDKLNFEENPMLIIRDIKYEVNSDALAILEVMELMENPTARNVKTAFETIFTKNAREDITKLKLGFGDFLTLVQEAIALITRETQENLGE